MWQKWSCITLNQIHTTLQNFLRTEHCDRDSKGLTVEASSFFDWLLRRKQDRHLSVTPRLTSEIDSGANGCLFLWGNGWRTQGPLFVRQSCQDSILTEKCWAKQSRCRRRAIPQPPPSGCLSPETNALQTTSYAAPDACITTKCMFNLNPVKPDIWKKE